MDNYVCAIGGINSDIKGISAGLTEDSHPGRIIITEGGVARNVSENLARLGIPVCLFGCTGNDEFGKSVLTSTSAAGVITEKVLVSGGVRTGIYLCVSDSKGRLNYAVNDMNEALARVNEEYLSTHIGFIKKSRMIFADANLSSEALEFILNAANESGVPVFIDTVSAVKSEKLKSLKGSVDYLSVNSQEFEALLGSAIDRIENSKNRKFKNIILRKGADGALLVSGSKIFRAEAGHVEVMEPNGAGDAFNAGFIFALISGKGEETALEYGIAAARFALESETSAGRELSAEKLEIKFRETKKR
ncbi:MAG: carbohydrate kinase family protein [Bacteroidetes bacterium]|nr:carbohydrate kinase family protein [Bacteroidota bacterium]